MEKTGKRPNFLLYGFILISLLIHIFIVLHVAGIYESRTISYIELSMQQLAKPDVRKIPKPRLRTKIYKIAGVETKQVEKNYVPNFRMGKIKAYKINNVRETIDTPRLPGSMDISKFFVPGLNIASDTVMVQGQEAPVEFINAKDYFEMIHLRIHSFKKYPKSAKSRHLEGRVNVQFVLSADGTLIEIKILKSSRHKRLDDAAIDAIKKASPFPRPPPLIFKTPVILKIDILFELA